MSLRLRVCALVAIVGIGGPILLAQQKPAPAAPAKKNPLLKLAEPWPEDDVLLARRTEAEARKLFQEPAPIEFTLTADFGTINKDRDPNSKKLYPATISLGTAELPVQLNARGHFRRNARNCAFVPLKVSFTKETVKDTTFDGHTELKLGTHCQNEKESDQYVLREFLTYRLANLVTPRSFRARLGKATYVDAKSKKPMTTRNSLFIEHENDVAKRMGGRDVQLQRIEFKDLDRDALTSMFLLEYMLGNTDYSIWALHNVVIVQDKKKTLIPVPYDFDLSGMVNPPYAVTDPRLRLRSITDRLYRGPCRTVEELDAAAEPFRAKKAAMLEAVDSMKDLNGNHRSEMKDYLESFFKTIDKPASIKKTFVDGCKPLPTM